MGSSTQLYLPLHVRANDLLMVVAKVAGEAWSLRTFDKDEGSRLARRVPVPFDPTLPASLENPWHVRFDRKDGPQISLTGNQAENFRLLFQDAAGAEHAWSYFPGYDQRDPDDRFVRRAHHLFPSSTPLAVATCIRLARFFGGEVFFNDGQEKARPDLAVGARQAAYPCPAKGSSANDQWYAFQNALNAEPRITAAELAEAQAWAGYPNEERSRALMAHLKPFDTAAALQVRLPDAAPTSRKPRF